MNDFADVEVRGFESQENEHERNDHWSYYLRKAPNDLPDRSRWRGLRAIGISISNTTRRNVESVEVRYYIFSTYVLGKRFAPAVCDHLGIENSLYWQLDVALDEDQSQIRKVRAN